ncbi:hypothetical protein, partial [Vibrio parahaemolyticus]|uniref:hypothetical protein n=1 Tax=Vibrio parahaemolyticus TaxID=670 RepID=UPI001B7CED69
NFGLFAEMGAKPHIAPYFFEPSLIVVYMGSNKCASFDLVSSGRVFPQSPLNSSAVIVFKEFFAYPCVYIRKFKIYTYTYTN